MRNIELSPQAQKTLEAARCQSSAWQPGLYRTQSQAIITRPNRGGPHYQAKLAGFIRASLPAFKFDSRADRWAGPLDQLSQARDILTSEYGGVYLSDGARDYLAGQQTSARVVLEYSHKSYAAPDDTTAWGCQARVTFAAGGAPMTSGLLAEVRRDLAGDGYTMRGAIAQSLYQRGRFEPTWREVWAK